MEPEPQIISDENWDLDNSYHNDVSRKKLLKGSNDHLEELFEYDDLAVYHYRKQIFAIDNSRPTKQLVFWMKYTIDTDVNLGIKIATQRAIWRDITVTKIMCFSLFVEELQFPLHKDHIYPILTNRNQYNSSS